MTFEYHPEFWSGSLANTGEYLIIEVSGPEQALQKAVLSDLADDLDFRVLGLFLDATVPGWGEAGLAQWMADSVDRALNRTVTTRVGTVLVSLTLTDYGSMLLKVEATSLGVSLSGFEEIFPDMTFEYQPAYWSTSSGDVLLIKVSGPEQALQDAVISDLADDLDVRVLGLFLDATVPGWREAGLGQWMADSADRASNRTVTTRVGTVLVSLTLQPLLQTRVMILKVEAR